MNDQIDSLIFRTGEIWKRSKTPNVCNEGLVCVAVKPLPGLDLDSLLPNDPLAAIRWAEAMGQPDLVEDIFYIKTDTIKISTSDEAVIIASREG
jgi:hypothetical protein